MTKRKMLKTLASCFVLLFLGGSSVEISASDVENNRPGSAELDGCVTTPGKNEGHCEPTVTGGYASVKAGLLQEKTAQGK